MGVATRLCGIRTRIKTMGFFSVLHTITQSHAIKWQEPTADTIYSLL
jgi:hypothetical protein